MGMRPSLTVWEKERIYRGKLAGKTISELAKEVECSHACARKWWRVGRDDGLNGIRAPRGGRQATGTLSRFAPQVRRKALRLKQEHERWGPERVLVELGNDGELAALPLPSRSRLACYFKEQCPELVAKRETRVKRPLIGPRAVEVHQVWQLDNQEGTELADGQVATICSVRDPVGAAMVASQAFCVNTAKRWRKLTVSEIRQVLRHAFMEWGTLPKAIQTDNESRFVGNPRVPFPSPLTLWLVGLGIEHLFIRPGQPTDQPHIERQHRTLANFTYGRKERANIKAFQQALDRERQRYNRHFPTKASQCKGRPPLHAYPQLQRPCRPYHIDLEAAIFNLHRVLVFLAKDSYERKVSVTGQVRIGGYKYNISRSYAGRSVHVSLDPDSSHWVFRLADSSTEVARCQAKGLDFQTITGLQPDDLSPPKTPFQLALPFFGAYQGVRLFQDS